MKKCRVETVRMAALRDAVDSDTDSVCSSGASECDVAKPEQPPAQAAACWLCEHKFGTHFLDSRNGGIHSMNVALDENKDLPVDQLAKLLQQVFEERVQRPLLLRDDDAAVPLCSHADIVAHLTHHVIDPALQLRQEIRSYNGWINKLERAIYIDGEINVIMYDRLLKTKSEKIKAVSTLKALLAR